MKFMYNLNSKFVPIMTRLNPVGQRESGARLFGLLGLCTLIGAFFFLPLNGLEQVGGFHIGDLFLLIAALAAVSICLQERRVPPIPYWLGLGVVLFTLGFFASEFLSGIKPEDLTYLLGAEFRASAFGYFVRLLLAILILPLVTSVLAPDWTPIRALVIAWIAGVTLSCLAALLDAALGTGIQIVLSSDPERATHLIRYASTTRSLGLTNHPNSLALSAVLIFPLVAAFIRDERTLLGLLPVLGILSVSVLISGSRTGLAGLMLALVGSIFLVWRNWAPTNRFLSGPRDLVKWSSVLALVGSGLVGVVFLVVSSDLNPSAVERLAPGQTTSVNSDTERSLKLSESLYLIGQRPLTGVGFQLVEYSHNVYLQVLLSGGLLALIGLLVIIGGFLVDGYRMVKAIPPNSYSLAVGLMISFTLFLVMAIFFNNIVDRYVFLAPALILAGLVGEGIFVRQDTYWRDALRIPTRSR